MKAAADIAIIVGLAIVALDGTMWAVKVLGK